MLSRVVGRHCESGDIVVKDCYLPADLAPGDLVAVAATGAYCRSLASNYNHLPRPGVVAVTDGAAREIVRRETLDDLLRLDVGCFGEDKPGKVLRVALLGCGVVGTQVARLLAEQADDLAVRTGARLELVGIAVRGSRTRARGWTPRCSRPTRWAWRPAPTWTL